MYRVLDVCVKFSVVHLILRATILGVATYVVRLCRLSLCRRFAFTLSKALERQGEVLLRGCCLITCYLGKHPCPPIASCQLNFSRFERLAYLEFDPGQSEFTPGGVAAPNVVQDHLLRYVIIQ